MIAACSFETAWQGSGLPQNLARQVQNFKLSVPCYTLAHARSSGTKALYRVLKSASTIPLLLSVSFLAVVLVFATTGGHLKLRKKSCQTKIAFDPHALQVLCTVFTPTSVSWPSSFLSCFKSARFATSMCIEINIVDLMEEILLGRIEVRDSNDLKYLSRGKLRVYGWSIKTYTDTRWWIKTTLWIAQQHLSVNRAYTRKIHRGSVCHSRILSPELSVWCFDLDFVQYVDLKTEISRLQRLHHSTSSIVVEFSCLATPIGLLTHDFMHCTIPFVPYLAGEKHGKRKNRTSAPLFANLPDIISMFSGGPYMIDNVANVSSQHAISLQWMEKELVDDKTVRQEYIQDVGMTGWREDRLMLAWEASLLRSGLINRWRITIRKNE